MIIFGACVGDGGAKFRRIAQRGIERIAAPEDRILTESGADGICRAYNRLIDAAIATPSCDALVLVHDDLEILDADARARLLAAAREPGAGISGVVGARGISSVLWWLGRQIVGGVYEPRGFLPVRRTAWTGPVDALDGMMLILSREAMQRLRFDEQRFPHFHGYDVDLCLQAREAGLRVDVLRLDVAHHSKGGVGDSIAFEAANRALIEKWPQLRRHERGLCRAVSRLHRPLERAAGRVRRSVLPRSLPAIELDASSEATLGAAVAGIRERSRRGGRDVHVWLAPGHEGDVALDRLVEASRERGLVVEGIERHAPATTELTSVAAHARARYLTGGGSWPVMDRARLRVSALPLVERDA